jgi:hypothetical protein
LLAYRQAEPNYKTIEWERDAEAREHYLSILTEFPDSFEKKYQPSRQMQRAKKKFLETIGARGPTPRSAQQQQQLSASVLAHTTARGDRTDRSFYEHRAVMQTHTHDAGPHHINPQTNMHTPHYINFNDYREVHLSLHPTSDAHHGQHVNEADTTANTQLNANSGSLVMGSIEEEYLPSHYGVNNTSSSVNNVGTPSPRKAGSAPSHHVYFSAKLGEDAHIDHTYHTPRDDDADAVANTLGNNSSSKMVSNKIPSPVNSVNSAGSNKSKSSSKSI